MRHRSLCTTAFVAALWVPVAGVMASALLLGTPAPALAEDAAPPDVGPDTVELVDGRKLTGELLAEDADYVTFRSAGITRAYRRADVAALRVGERPETTDAAPDGAQKNAGKQGTKGKPKGDAKPKKTKGADRDRRDSDEPLSAAAAAWLTAIVQTSDPGDADVMRALRSAVSSLGPRAEAPLRAALATVADDRRPVIEDLLAHLQRIKEKLAAQAGEKASRGKAATDKAPTDRATDEMGGGGEMGGGSDDTSGKPSDPRLDRKRGRNKAGAKPEQALDELGLEGPARDEVSRAISASQTAQLRLLRGLRKEGTDPEVVLSRLDELRTELVAAAAPHLDADQQRRFGEWAGNYFAALRKRVAAKVARQSD